MLTGYYHAPQQQSYVKDPVVYPQQPNYANEPVEEEGIAPVGTEGMWQCLKCAKMFSQKSSCNRHYLTMHMENIAEPCRFCKRTFKNKNSLRQHLRDTHGMSQKNIKNRVVPKPQHS